VTARFCFALMAWLTVWPALSGGLPKLPRLDTRYYVIYSKLDKPALREASARLTAMAREYHRRTSAFSKTVKKRLPIYLFDGPEAYYAAGGLEGSAGVYTGKTVMGLYLRDRTDYLWSLLQHECWHQFCRESVGGRWPAWLNEGMAEYYAASMWTGDEFMTGLVPMDKLLRMKLALSSKALKRLDTLVAMDHQQWNEEISAVNYLQSWSLVHFLAHAEDGRYRKYMGRLIVEAARSKAGLDSFRRIFGARRREVEARWRKWWTELTPEAAAKRGAEVTVSTLTSFLGRGHMAGLRFKTIQDFAAALNEGKLLAALKSRSKLWLPESLLQRQLAAAGKYQDWSLVTVAGAPALRLGMGDTVLTGTFRNDPGSALLDVNVAESRPKPAP